MEQVLNKIKINDINLKKTWWWVLESFGMERLGGMVKIQSEYRNSPRVPHLD